ncbi:MAG: N-acyl-D-amino-acid deacylase [Gammaproteobacteria bacterium]
MKADLVIAGGTVIDGTGAPPRVADVAVCGDEIIAVDRLPLGDAQVVDATGLIVAPGFVDIHSHSDYTLLVDPRASSAVHQGVTTEVIGNCGFGCFPLRDAALARTAIYGVSDAQALDWSSPAEYLARLEAARPAVNVLSLVPNGQLRLSTVGLEERPATAGELKQMGRLLSEGLADGAWGYSTGLEYGAEIGAPEAEITHLCGITARAGALYATHTRRRDAGAAEAVAEALRTARNAEVRLQVSHLLPRNGPIEAERCIALVDAAAHAGQDVAFDMHTRRYGLTYLHTMLPPWVLARDREGIAAALSNDHDRARMKDHRSIFSAGNDWTRVVLLDNPVWPQYARRSFSDIATERGQDPFDTAFDLLRGSTDNLTSMMAIINCYDEDEQERCFTHPLCVPGSDATDLAPDGPLADTFFHGAYTWAAWYFRFMVRQRGALSAQEAIHRLSGRPASVLGLSDRGVLRAGARADLVVFDPDQFADRGTTFEPNQLATGMHHVFVNGVQTLRAGAATGQRAGRVLRRTRDQGQW